LRAFNARAYLSTSVMLGVASERAVELVSRSLIEALDDPATKLEKAIDDPRTSPSGRFSELRKRLEPLRPQLPEGLADTLTLDAVADLVRVARNEAGHPTGVELDEDTAYTHLQVVARYLQTMTALRVFLTDEQLSP
jgi:hypothetical protein